MEISKGKVSIKKLSLLEDVIGIYFSSQLFILPFPPTRSINYKNKITIKHRINDIKLYHIFTPKQLMKTK